MAEWTNEKYSMLDPRTQTERDREYGRRMEAYFSHSLGTNMDKLRHFAKFVPRQVLAKFLAKRELFQHVLRVHGHILECGVYLGDGLLTWAQLSSIYEPVNHLRRIVGFDTFTGFPEVTQKDKGDNQDRALPRGLPAHAYDDLMECLELYDLNRPLGHIPRVEAVAGDAVQTIPEYVRKNPHLVVALLYLDFDLYEPTKLAIETFLPRMPKGAVLAFDELCQARWPGETLAVIETVGLSNLRIRRFPFYTTAFLRCVGVALLLRSLQTMGSLSLQGCFWVWAVTSASSGRRTRSKLEGANPNKEGEMSHATL